MSRKKKISHQTVTGSISLEFNGKSYSLPLEKVSGSVINRLKNLETESKTKGEAVNLIEYFVRAAELFELEEKLQEIIT